MPALYRSPNKLLAGVAGGLAEKLGLHPAIVRVAWLVSIPFTWFLSAVAYAVLAFVLPVRATGEVPARPRAGLADLSRQGFTAFWAAHGLIHVIGFAVAWKVMTFGDMAYSTTALWGRLELGDAGARILGIAWLVMVPLFLYVAFEVVRGSRRSIGLVATSAAGSLAVCLLGSPNAIAGVAIDAAALVGLAAYAAARGLATRPSLAH